MSKLMILVLGLLNAATAPTLEDMTAELEAHGFYNVEFYKQDGADFRFEAEEWGCTCAIRIKPVEDGFDVRSMCLD